jgi:3-hydroxyisobutyrate dehydrogenase
MAERADEVYQNAIEAGFSDIDYTGVLAYLKKINS